MLNRLHETFEKKKNLLIEFQKKHFLLFLAPNMAVISI